MITSLEGLAADKLVVNKLAVDRPKADKLVGEVEERAVLDKLVRYSSVVVVHAFLRIVEHKPCHVSDPSSCMRSGNTSAAAKQTDQSKSHNIEPQQLSRTSSSPRIRIINIIIVVTTITTRETRNAAHLNHHCM
jgi:hypothetical protein